MPAWGWVTATVADLRREPQARAERVSQLPIFTPVEILFAQPGWYQVRGPDGYTGWAREAQIQLGELPPPLWKVRVPWAPVREARGQRLLGWMPLDARFSGPAEGNKVFLRWPSGETAWVAKRDVYPAAWVGSGRDLLRLAEGLVGVPYLWGGTTPFGFDCSGFVQRLFHFVFNHWLPRDSQDQQGAGVKILAFSALQPGDLLCFPGHVGLFMGRGVLAHASATLGRVTLTPLEAKDPYGQELRREFLFGVRPLQLASAHF